jgi:phage shock protein PspC (stress-responsive transcriptional regulator)
METDEMKRCPWCAEMVRAEASKCRYCGSNLETRDPAKGDTYWQRVEEGKVIAGVCTGLVRQFGTPVLILPLRLAFVATTFLWLFGPVLYILLWILMPAPKADSSKPSSRDRGTEVPAGSPESAVGGAV